MRTILPTISALAVTMLTCSVAQAKSEMQCQVEARELTGEIQGFDYTQAVTACMLDNLDRRPDLQRENGVSIEERTESPVAFSTSRRTASGTWVRVSPYRWVLKPD